MRLLILIIFFITYPLHAAELVLTSVPTPIQSDSAASKATKAWAALLNKADPVFLDHFIVTYSQSDEAQVAFTLRFNGVQTSRSIPHYHAFLDKYAGTLAAEQALYELFELYRQQNTVAGYFDFIKRYPNTPQAVVAQLHIEALAFELTSQLNIVEEYDAFIDLFPQATQVSAAEQLAQKKALVLETAYLETEQARLKNRLAQEQKVMAKLDARLAQAPEQLDKVFWEEFVAVQNSITGLINDISLIRENRANQLATLMEQAVSDAEAVLDDKTLTEEERNRLVQYYWRVAKRYFYLLRSELYRNTPAAKRVRSEERHQRIMAKLEEIRQVLIKSHDALIVALQEEFAKTRQTLRDGFARLHRDNVLMNQSLQQLVASVNVLHQDLEEVNQNLKKIHQGLTEVQATVAKTNAHLSLLHEDLDRVRSHLVQLNQDMNQGMATQKTLLRAVAGTVKKGFTQLHADMEARQLQTASLHQEKLALANRQLYANRRIAKALEKTHQQSLKQRARQTEQLRQTIHSQGKAIVNAQNLTLKSVEHQTQITLYNTEKLLASDRQTQGLISQQTQQFAQIAEQRSRSDSGGGFWDGVKGLVKGVVSTAANYYLPGSGDIAGALVGVVSDVVQGKDIDEAFIGGAKGIVGEHCPPCAPAMDIAEGLVQGKNPQDILLTVAKNQLGESCPKCTPFVDMADGLLKGDDPLNTLEIFAKSQLGEGCPECVQVWDTAKGITQGDPKTVITALVNEKIIEHCPDCAPVLDTIQEIAEGKNPLDIVVETTQRQLAKDCPECGEVLQTIIPIAQQEALDQTQQVLTLLQNQVYNDNLLKESSETLNVSKELMETLKKFL